MKRIVSEATKEKQRQARLRFLANGGEPGMLGRKQSDKQKNAVRKANLGNDHGVGQRSQEFKNRISEIAQSRDMGLRRGATNSSEHNRKIKEGLRNFYDNNEVPQSRKDLLSEASKRVWKTKEYRDKFSKARKGYKLTKEHKDKITEASRRLHKDAGYIKKQKDGMHRPEVTAKLKENRAKRVLPLKDTSIEIALQNELSSKGIVFEKHKKLPGLPDIFISPNICIFADGDYWHSNPKSYDKNHVIRYGSKVLSQKEIWAKDEKINKILRGKGYIVFRFWGSDIKKNARACINQIKVIHS